MLSPNSSGCAGELLQSNMARRNAGQPIEVPEERRQRVEALSDDRLKQFAAAHGVGISPLAFNRSDIVETLLSAGVGEPIDFRGLNG